MPEVLEVKNCIVAFIDLLGTSEAIRKDHSDINLYLMNYIYQSAFDMCSDHSMYKEEIKVKAFSDNIVFGIELPDKFDRENFQACLRNILEMCAYFQIAAFGCGIAVRGGITVGDFFCNDIFVWGKGLLRAYDLESKIAVYPRIILDTDVLDLIEEYDSVDGKCHSAEDVDGVTFLDYLSYLPLQNRDEHIKRSLDDTKIYIANCSENERAVQKWKWIVNYLNRRLSNG